MIHIYHRLERSWFLLVTAVRSVFICFQIVKIHEIGWAFILPMSTSWNSLAIKYIIVSSPMASRLPSRVFLYSSTMSFDQLSLKGLLD